MGAIRAPAGTKLYGVNIVPTPTEVETGIRAWAGLHVDWPWEAWIKPQIDSAVSNGIGCNCIRMIGDFLRHFHRTIQSSHINDHWVQLVKYCAERGIYVIVCGGDQNQVSKMTDRDISSNVISLLKALGNFDNVATCRRNARAGRMVGRESCRSHQCHLRGDQANDITAIDLQQHP